MRNSYQGIFQLSNRVDAMCLTVDSETSMLGVYLEDSYELIYNFVASHYHFNMNDFL